LSEFELAVDFGPLPEGSFSISERLRDQYFDAVVAVLSSLLHAYDPEEIGATVFGPADAYDDSAKLLIRKAGTMPDISELVKTHYPNCSDQLLFGLAMALELYLEAKGRFYH